PIDATPDIVIDVPSADLQGGGKLDATPDIVLGFASVDLQATGKLDAPPTLVFDIASADLGGLGKLDAPPTIIFDIASADLQAGGQLDATPDIVFAAPSVDLKAKGQLDGTPDVVFTVPSADLTDATAVGPIDATPDIVFDVASADLKAGGKLDAAATIVFDTASALLRGLGLLAASASIVFAAPSVDLGGGGQLDAAATIVLGVPSADLGGNGALDASPGIVFTVPSASLTNATPDAGGAQTDAYPLRRIPWTTQPPAGTRVDWTHPLLEGASFVCGFNDVGETRVQAQGRTKEHTGAFTGNPTWEAGQGTIPQAGDISLETSVTAAEYVDFPDHPDLLPNVNAITVFWMGDMLDDDAQTLNRYMLDKTSDNTDGWRLFKSAGVGDDAFRWRLPGLSTANTDMSGLVWEAGDTVSVCGTWDGAVSSIYFNGAFENSEGSTGTLSLSPIALWVGDNHAGEATIPNQRHRFVAIFGVAVSAETVAALHENPWQVYEPRRVPLLIESAAPVATQTDVYPIRRTERRTQPPPGTPIDWSNPICRDLVFVGPNYKQNEVTSNLIGEGILSATTQLDFTTEHGIAALFNPDTDDGGIQWLDEQLIVGNLPVTFWAWANPGADSENTQPFLQQAGGSGQCLLAANTDNTITAIAGQLTFGFSIDASNRGLIESDSTTIIDGTFKKFSGSGTPGTSTAGHKIFVDGVLIATTANQIGDSSGWSSSTNSTALMRTAEIGFDGHCPNNSLILGLAWTRELSDDEQASLADNPWQIYMPERRPFLIESGAAAAQTDVYPLRRVPWTEKP
ncbi:MAG: hypothetical protein V3S69_06170, partial [Dehalococcoidales bacterium]